MNDLRPLQIPLSSYAAYSYAVDNPVQVERSQVASIENRLSQLERTVSAVANQQEQQQVQIEELKAQRSQYLITADPNGMIHYEGGKEGLDLFREEQTNRYLLEKRKLEKQVKHATEGDLENRIGAGLICILAACLFYFGGKAVLFLAFSGTPTTTYQTTSYGAN